MELTAWVAPFFIVMSPILSYADQIISMYRNKTSAGFSLDIPLIMLVASFLRFDYPFAPCARRGPWLTRASRHTESSTGLKPNTIRVFSYSRC
jgi:hypothetical protein